RGPRRIDGHAPERDHGALSRRDQRRIRGVQMSAAGPSQGTNCATSGGAGAHAIRLTGIRETTMTIDATTRRDFLRLATRAGMLTTLSGLGLLGARPARAAVTDFKALVCVYLYGGND